MANIFKDYKCPICNGILTIHKKEEDCGYYSLDNPRLVCNHCKIKGGYAGLMLTEEQERERLIYNFEKAVASRKANDLRKPEKILTDIRDYLVKTKEVFEKTTDFKSVLFGAGVQVFVEQAIADLTEYAEKLGVEL